MSQGRLPFEYAPNEESVSVTAWSGLPLVAEAMDAFGASAAIREKVKLSGQKFAAEEMAKAFILSFAAGGDCVADIEVLRADEPLQRLLNMAIPAQSTALQWLVRFHDASLIEKAKREAELAGLKAYVPEESEALKGLTEGQKALIAEAQRRWPSQEATLDFDATIEESHKREALPHYLDGRGYQPQLCCWAEQELIVLDQFRDGNVPAHYGALDLVKEAFAALPAGIERRFCRADTQLYSPEVLQWLSSEGIEFAIGAQKRGDFEERCAAVPATQWRRVATRPDTVVDAAFVGYRPTRMEAIAGLRYIAVRMTPMQTELLEEGTRRVVYLAVVSNRPGDPAEVLRWYWGKAGTIERVHDVLKNEVGAGVLPSGKFGANAAWFRLAAITFNILRVIRRMGPDHLKDARPKRLRLHVFAVASVLVSHARSLWARVARGFLQFERLEQIRRAIWSPPALLA